MRAFAKLVAYASKASVGKWWKRQKGKNLKKAEWLKRGAFDQKIQLDKGFKFLNWCVVMEMFGWHLMGLI